MRRMPDWILVPIWCSQSLPVEQCFASPVVIAGQLHMLAWVRF